jgi:hypothetical protein
MKYGKKDYHSNPGAALPIAVSGIAVILYLRK